MKQLKLYLFVLAITLLVFGCGKTPSEKIGSDDEQVTESLSGSDPAGKVADVSQIDHDEYMEGSHKGFTCSDCHNKSKPRNDDEYDSSKDYGEYKEKEKKKKKDRKDKKKHRDHGDKKDDKRDKDDDDSDDSKSSDDSNGTENTDDTDEFVHTDDFTLCTNCHSGFPRKHTNANFSSRCNECHKSGNGNWTADLRYDYDHTGLTNCVNCHSHEGNENVNDHNGETCENCHAYDNWEDTPVQAHNYSDNCKGCHLDDRPSSHPDSSSTDMCKTCHSYNQGWGNGVHEATTGCADCHDQTASDMGPQCETCHEYDDWTQTIGGGSHDTTGCSSCHAGDAPNSHPSNMDNCEACHSNDAGWNGGVHEAFSTCTDCHTSTSNRSQHNTSLQCKFCHSDLSSADTTGSGNNNGGGNNPGNPGNPGNSGNSGNSGGSNNSGGSGNSGGGNNSGNVTYPINLVGTGNIGECKSNNIQNTGTYKTGLLIDQVMNDYSNVKIFVGGDNQYNNGDQSEYESCYSQTKWGDYVQQTPYAIIGDHDKTRYAHEYFSNSLLYDAYTGDNGRTYWSEDVGSWHIIGLNTETSMTSGSAQYQWLEADLNSNDGNANNKCTIAMMHRPRYSTSQNGDFKNADDAWQLLYNHGTDIVFSGHEHAYQRFSPIDPNNGSPVADNTFGITQFVVGTGGASFHSLGKSSDAGSLLTKAIGNKFGVMRYEFFEDYFNWEFIQADGSIGDSGTTSCHGAP